MEQLISLAFKLGPVAVVIIILAVIALPQALRILREYERGVIFRLGKLLGAKGPGIIFLIPVVDRMVKMDLRVVTIDVARQEIMTKDNVPATVDAVVYWISLEQWSAMTPAEAQSLDDYCDERGLELGIDVAGWHTDQIALQRDFQKDLDEFREEEGRNAR